jgi:hypothetical protein
MNTLRRDVDLMEEHELLTRRRGVQGRRTSSIAASEWFISIAGQKGVSNADFGWREEEEVIVLRSSTRSVEPGRYEGGRIKRRVDYKDTRVTNDYRAEVVALNRFLEAADIRFVDDGENPTVLPQDRRLGRYFTMGDDGPAKAWQRGGRLFGGFWINLKKHRRAHIRIQGEPLVLLDFSSMFLRLAYANVKAGCLTDPDPYDLTGFLDGYDNDLHRKGAK